MVIQELSPSLHFLNLCRENSFHVSDDQINSLENFRLLLLSSNKKINLISRQDENNFWLRHILGSVSFLFKFQLLPESTMLDIGTGGGLPGIPLAILNPKMKFMLIDSIQKKVGAVKAIIAELKLPNVSIECGRAEELSKQSSYAQKFDYIISRAVASIKDLIRWSRPFVKPRKENVESISRSGNRALLKPGSILMLKGGDLSKESEAAIVKLKPKSLETFALPMFGAEDLFDKKIVVVQP